MAETVPVKPRHSHSNHSPIAPFLKFPRQGLESQVYVLYLYTLGMEPGTEKVLNKPTMNEQHTTPRTAHCSQQQSQADNVASLQPPRPSCPPTRLALGRRRQHSLGVGTHKLLSLQLRAEPGL